MSSDRFEILYRNAGPQLWRALVAFSGDREIAGDAMAEAVARGDAIREPMAWVWKVSFLLIRAELKRRAEETTLDVERPYEHPEGDMRRQSPNLPLDGNLIGGRIVRDSLGRTHEGHPPETHPSLCESF